MFSVSYTTRQPRGTEKDGESYHFVSRPEFEAMIARDEFLEWARGISATITAPTGHSGGSPLRGKDLVLDIDVQGARQLKIGFPRRLPSSSWLPRGRFWKQGLRARGEDRDEVIERRLRDAAEEIRRYKITIMF
jgi:guanylate kinase